jgi:hypothetical protein
MGTAGLHFGTALSWTQSQTVKEQIIKKQRTRKKEKKKKKWKVNKD